MRKYLEKREDGVYYIAEGYNEGKMKTAGFSNATDGISAGRKMIREMGDGFSDVVYGIKWVDECAIYAACEKKDVKKIEDYTIVNTVGELIGKGGRFWSKYAASHIGEFMD